MRLTRPDELAWPDRNLADELDYTLDMSDEVVTGDSITAVTATVIPSGTLQVARTAGPPLYVTGTSVIVWLSGGSPGQVYLVRLIVTLLSGRVFDELVSLRTSTVFLNDTPLPSPEATWP